MNYYEKLNRVKRHLDKVLVPDSNYRFGNVAYDQSGLKVVNSVEKFDFYIVTRFNLWIKKFRSLCSIGITNNDFEYDKWVEERVRLFDIPMASLQSQVNNKFKWLVLFDTEYNFHADNLFEQLKAFDWIMPVRFDNRLEDEDKLRQFVVTTISENSTNDSDYIITSRLDSDDALNISFVESVLRYASCLPNEMLHCKKEPVLNFPYGLQYEDYNLYSYIYRSNPFYSRIEPKILFLNGTAKTSIFGNHGKLDATSNVIDVQTLFPMWLQNCHGNNVLNKAKHFLPKIANTEFELIRFGLSSKNFKFSIEEDLSMSSQTNLPDSIFFKVTPEIMLTPRRLVKSAWLGHIPFAFYLTKLLKPNLFVELGTFTGPSYSAFCQIVENEKLATKCFAVDTWQGDGHAGLYDDRIFDEFSTYHAQQNWSFSQLMRMTFDQAVLSFEDKSIDLLHIDGYHTYDAVKHDFLTWKQKLSDRSVVLFHDISSSNPDFGVGKFWDEIRSDFPHISFGHSGGLGVLGYGNDLPSDVMDFFVSAKNENLKIILNVFQKIGDSWQFRQRAHDLATDISKVKDQKIRIKILRDKSLLTLNSLLGTSTISSDSKSLKLLNDTISKVTEIGRYT